MGFPLGESSRLIRTHEPTGTLRLLWINIPFKLRSMVSQSHSSFSRPIRTLHRISTHGSVAGAHQSQQARLVDGLVEEETGARREPFRNSSDALIVANEDDGRHLVNSGPTHLPRKLNSAGSLHPEIEQNHGKLLLAKGCDRIFTAA